jgi:exopolyphosphatase/guanosine-5'-triphosphate,3'-diphosphate pyrophosphatase
MVSPVSESSAPLRAIISLGSNSTRLLIARTGEDGRLEPIEQAATGTRLSEGMGEGGSLSDAGRERTLAAIAEFVERARAHRAPVVCISTSVMRRAADGGAFSRAIEALTGVPLRVIDGEEEASSSFAGATYRDAGGGARIAVVDLGGGSIECAVGVDGDVIEHASVEVGAVRLAERYPATMGGETAEAARQAGDAARRDAGERLAPFERLRPVDEVRIVGGTANTTAAIAQAQGAAQVVLSRAEIDAIVDRLLGMTLTQRRAVPGMIPQRADILPAGGIIISEALGRLGVIAARVERNDLLLGYLARTGPTTANG